MKTLITTLNAKFIHTALSIRLLYVATMEKHDVQFKEYTIKDDLSHIAQDILDMGIEVVAFSCYIWNIAYIKTLCQLLKAKKPQIKIILGGPEVTYEPAHFIENYEVDYVMSGEGEETFGQLLEVIEKALPCDVVGVSYPGHISHEVACVDLKLVEKLASPYDLAQDRKDKSKRILYFETSRGCPFQCQYCLSSLEKGLRFFSHEYLEKQLDIVIHSGAKVVKLLDRSFNADAKHAIFILDYIFKHHVPNQQFQFEINADVFQQEIVDFINMHAPKGLLRFEIGIQSTYEPTNRAVKRMQNFDRLSDVIKQLMAGGKCDLHLDLIAGLPYEGYQRFAQSFDEVFAFRAKELQLGFLKMLRGTSLRNDAEQMGYDYDENPPYEMTKNDWMTNEDMKKIHLAEDMLEKYWNSGRFPISMNAIMDEQASPFFFFYELACFYQGHQFKRLGYQVYDLCTCLDEFTNQQYRDLIIQDYLSIHKTKPKKWYEMTLNKAQRHQVIEALANRYQLNKDELYRYSIIEELKDGYLVAIYRDMNVKITRYDKEGIIHD